MSFKISSSRRTSAIERISPGDADREKAVLCPWFNSGEWEQVYEWLYSSEPQLVERGIARVSAWKARAPRKLPLVVETTADLAECMLNDRQSKTCVARALCLGYCMAITRFVNGMNDTVHSYGRGKGSIKNTVQQYGIPSWVVDLRHYGTHQFLPPIGRCRTAAQFALNWLRANYWRPQRMLIRQEGKSTLATPTIHTPPGNSVDRRQKPTNKTVDSAVAKLTFGLCTNRAELVDLLTSCSQAELSENIMNRKLLYFPHTVKITVTGPDLTDLVSLPSLKGELVMWRKHLLRAAERDSSFKHKLTSALIITTHSTDSTVQRDYFASWLGLLLVDQYEVDSVKPSKEQVVTIVDDDDQFIPGSLNWVSLLQVVKDHPGHYTHAISTLIDGHLLSSLPLSVREHVLYLSQLITISERIGPSLPHTVEGPMLQEFNDKIKSLLKRKADSSPHHEPPQKKKSRLGASTPRWGVVIDVIPWVNMPLGACPGQVMSASCLDLPAFINNQPERTKKSQRRCDVVSVTPGHTPLPPPTLVTGPPTTTSHTVTLF